jgi:subtilisin family serine protease
MFKRFYFIIFLVMICSITAYTGNVSNSPKIMPELRAQMLNAGENQLISAYIVLSNHLNLSDFDDIPYDTPKKERRQLVVNRLISHANLTQRSIKTYLDAQTAAGKSQYRDILWICNTITVDANAETINNLAENFSEISYIGLDASFPIEMLYDEPQARAPFWNAVPLEKLSNDAPEPGVVLMNADDVWALGNKGEGVTVCNADDGFHWRHPDVVNGLWQNLGEDANNNGMTVIWGAGVTSQFDAGDINGVDNDGNGKVDDLIGWDWGANSYNIGASSHGTATLGHVVGDGTGGTQTGVSPKAKSMVHRHSGINTTNLLGSFQYGIQMGAEIVHSSLSYKWGFNPKPDYSLFRLTTDMELAAGVIHANSTSNDGNSYGVPLNISTAGNCPAPWRHPDQLKVGNLSAVIGCGNVNCNTDVISSSSPWGPFTWGNWSLWMTNGIWPYPIAPGHSDYPYSRVAPVEIPDSMGLLKPDVSAPGESSISTYVSSGTGYGTFGGTSSATPHTAGCLALMLSINPEMLPRDLDRVLELTAVEKGDPGKDYRYGAGRIDALLATTSPSPLFEGVNGGSNWLLGNTTVPNDTARELVGLKLKNTSSPWIGSLRTFKFFVGGSVVAADVEKFRLFFDVNKNNIVDAGDRLLKEAPFTGAAGTLVTMDTIKFKVTDSLRNIIVAIKTKSTAVSTHTCELGMPNNNMAISYYTVNAQPANFPFGTIVSVGGITENPFTYSLSQNYPNPFNPMTIISYSLAEKSFVRLVVYDVVGREVAVLMNNVRDRGQYNIEFDASQTRNISSGVYLYKLEVSDPDNRSAVRYSDIRKMMLVK